MYDKMQKAIAVLILTPVVIVIISAIFSALIDDGVIFQVWLSMINQIPFGGRLAELCVNIFTDSFGMGYDMSKYMITSQNATVILIFKDSSRLILSAVFYEVVNTLIQKFLGVWKKQSGIHNVLMQMASGMISIVLCTFIATYITDSLFRGMSQLSNITQGIISLIISVITIAGAYGFVVLVLGVTLLGSIAFVGVKIILINTLKVVASYVGILLLILFINEGAYLKVLATVSGWGVVIVLLVGAEIMLTSIFSKS